MVQFGADSCAVLFGNHTGVDLPGYVGESRDETMANRVTDWIQIRGRIDEDELDPDTRDELVGRGTKALWTKAP